MTAKIKLNAASGGGSFSLQAPSSSSNNRVITLPDIADGTLLTSSSGVGITMADQWRLTTDRNLSSITETIDSNWERNDSSGYGPIGSAMTESSGIFTFPSTGIYLISFNLTMYSISSTQRYAGALISRTTDNSTYNTVATSYTNGGVNASNGVYMSAETKFLFDVVDTANYKVLFRAQCETASPQYISTSTNESITQVTFLRLGDT